MTKAAPISVDVISDVMCPWCYIGKKHLDEAISQATELDVSVTWRPYQLDPTLPKEGRDRAEYLNNKFGGEEGAKSVYERIYQAGKTVGIDFNFEGIEVSPNTLDAHRVLLWAGGQGAETQEKVARRLFEMFFREGRNIGDNEVLCEAAADGGMDAQVVRDLLESDADRDRVEAEIEHARTMGITGVPCFIVNRKYAVMGAQPADQILLALRHAASEAETDDQSA